MPGTPFIIGYADRQALTDLRDRAAREPVDMPPLLEQLKTPEGKAAHKRRMTDQSLVLPFGYLVTFSIEINHPSGTCRHMSMSSPVEGRVPIPAAVWMVAEILGFTGGIDRCVVWLEDLEGHEGKAVNVVQPIAVSPEHRA